MESTINSPASIPGAPFAFIAAAPGFRLVDDGNIDNPAAEQPGLDKPSAPTASIVPEHNGKALFDPGCGDIKLMVNGICFETHEYLLRRFSVLKQRLQKRSSAGVLRLKRYEHNVEDFNNTFKVLYASVLEGPLKFDGPTLVSALRIASLYDYPVLRSYAIQHLERANLPAIERIKIAREFELTPWEGPSFKELYERKEPITRQEAKVLGLDDYVRVVNAREKEHQRAERASVPRAETGTSGGEKPGENITGWSKGWWILVLLWLVVVGFLDGQIKL